MYEYGSLPDRCIRLLSLKMDEDSEPLGLSISVHCLDNDPVYKSLSYVWGDASDRRDIVVFNEDHNENTFSITNSLYRALRRLRSGGCHHYIWADAICINQRNNKEKTAQVRMMTEIYTRANSVYGWLGESKPEDVNGFHLLKTIARIRKAESEDMKRKIIEHLVSPATYVLWAALWGILMRPWFRRVWIIQEVVVARRFCFVCNDAVVTGEDFFAAIEIIATYPDIGNVFLYSTTAANRERLTTSNFHQLRECYRNSNNRSIQYFLSNSGRFKAIDPRDKVFSLIALCDDVDNSFIDYDLDERSVYRLIQSLQLRIAGVSTQALGFGCMGKYFEDLPSWVCQWRIDGETDRLPLSIIYPTVSAPANLIDVVRCVDGIYHLQMSSIMFDSIGEYIPWSKTPLLRDQTAYRLAGASRLSQLNHNEAENVIDDIHGQARFMHQCIQLVQKIAEYPTGHDLDEVLWRAYLFDTTIHGQTPAPASYGLLFQQLRQCYALLSTVDKIGVFGPATTEVPDRVPNATMQMEVLLFSLGFMFCWSKSLFPRTIWHWIILTLAFPIVLILLELGLYLLASLLPFKQSRKQKFAMEWKNVKNGMILAGVGMFGRLRDGRNFGVTSKGYVGWFPMAARKDDILCFLEHSDVPLVLRKTDVPATYTLVGDCYIQGLMNRNRSSLEDIKSMRILIR